MNMSLGHLKCDKRSVMSSISFSNSYHVTLFRLRLNHRTFYFNANHHWETAIIAEGRQETAIIAEGHQETAVIAKGHQERAIITEGCQETAIIADGR